MCDIGLFGWIGALVYVLFIAAVGSGVMFGVGYVALSIIKRLSGSSKLP